MSFIMVASITQAPLDVETVDAVLEGEVFAGVSMARVFDNFNEFKIILASLGFRDAEQRMRQAAKYLRGKPESWQSADYRVVVRKNG